MMRNLHAMLQIWILVKDDDLFFIFYFRFIVKESETDTHFRERINEFSYRLDVGVKETDVGRVLDGVTAWVMVFLRWYMKVGSKRVGRIGFIMVSFSGP